MRNYLISSIAEQDIEEIVGYIARDNSAAAQKILDVFFKSMDKLSLYPRMGQVRVDLTDEPVRFWLVKSRYMIIYKDTDPIEIVRVLSTYRDIATLLV